MIKAPKKIPVKNKQIPNIENVEFYDFKKRPVRVNWFWLGIEKLVAPLVIGKYKKNFSVQKINMENVVEPYLLLATHMSFLDFATVNKATDCARFGFVMSLDGAKDYSNWLVRRVGTICKRKFTKDIILIKNMRYMLNTLKQNVGIYPEAKYSLDGTTSFLPDTLGKLAKLLKVDVVVARLNGNYLADSQWRQKKVCVPLRVDLIKVASKSEVELLTEAELQKLIVDHFSYNEYQYQLDNNILITEDYRANHLNRLLYICPECLTEYDMEGLGIYLTCRACKASWILNENGTIHKTEGETKFSSIPDWFAWQKKMVRQEILDNKYNVELKVNIATLPSSKGFYFHGDGVLTHNMEGFKLQGVIYNQEKILNFNAKILDGVHIEYNYKNCGSDVVIISNNDDSFWCFTYMYKDIITKISLATDILFELYKNKLI